MLFGYVISLSTTRILHDVGPVGWKREIYIQVDVDTRATYRHNGKIIERRSVLLLQTVLVVASKDEASRVAKTV